MRRTLALVVLLIVFVAPAAAHTNHVSADAQISADGTVVVEALFPADDAWLALHLDDGGDPGAVVGYRRVAGGEFHEDTPVKIENETWRNWTDSRRLHVVLHNPDGDGEFDPAEDEAIVSFGDVVGDELWLEKGSTARVTDESFGPEETDDSTISIRSAHIPDDGYVVLHNGSADGAVVGHTALEAGGHDSVQVALDEAFYRDRGEQFTVFATLVVDDGDGKFDADDSRLAVDGEPVGTLLGVTKVDNGTATGETESAGSASTATATTATSPVDQGSPVGIGGLETGAIVAAAFAAILWWRSRRSG
ncbi:MAG: hypothetical protein ABEH81_11500 [Halopenitus sp.]